MTANAGHRLFEFEFTKDKKVNRVGGGYRLKAAEKALDVFDEACLLGLFYDFVYEIFVTSNFKLYNHNVEIIKVPLQNDGNIYSFQIRATSDKSLALTKIQVKNRDNIIIDE